MDNDDDIINIDVESQCHRDLEGVRTIDVQRKEIYNITEQGLFVTIIIAFLS